jgi:hypothetical protein
MTLFFICRFLYGKFIKGKHYKMSFKTFRLWKSMASQPGYKLNQ